MDLEMLHERANIIRRARAFFDDRGYLELDTPLLAPDLIPESCLEVFETSRILPSGGASPYWLIPSPEIWMKKIIARHRASVYQICKCFRNGESSGFLHSPEFTMLEYYTMDANYLDSLALTEELFAFLGIRDQGSGIGELQPSPKGEGSPPDRCSQSERIGNSPCSLTKTPTPFLRMTMAEAFDRFAGFDLFAAAEAEGALETAARRLGLDPPPGMGTAELYDLIFIHAVEPQLKQERPVALLDYPAFVPCLARKAADGKTVERWELYWNGIELANCYTEETDAEQVRAFFESEAAAKERKALVRHRVDHDYWKNFQGTAGTRASGTPPLPPCSGVALGLDRLIMALCGKSSIDSVLPFPM